jgi:hypothetical protein
LACLVRDADKPRKLTLGDQRNKSTSAPDGGLVPFRIDRFDESEVLCPEDGYAFLLSEGHGELTENVCSSEEGRNLIELIHEFGSGESDASSDQNG